MDKLTLNMIAYYQRKSAKHHSSMAFSLAALGICIVVPCLYPVTWTVICGVVFGLISLVSFVCHWICGAEASHEAEYFMKYGW